MFKVQDLLLRADKYHTWVDDLLRSHSGDARPVSSINFPRLAQFYAKETYESSRFVVVDKLPQLPWAEFDLPVPTGMNNEFGGITYRNTYFVVPAAAQDESLHYHEMVHVVQWYKLGNDLFPLLYGLEVFSKGYADCFFEITARHFQSIFNKCEQIISCEAYVTFTLGSYLPGLFNMAMKGEL